MKPCILGTTILFINQLSTLHRLDTEWISLTAGCIFHIALLQLPHSFIAAYIFHMTSWSENLPHDIMEWTAHVLTASGLVGVTPCSHCLLRIASRQSIATQAPQMHRDAECKQVYFTSRHLTKWPFCLTDVNASTTCKMWLVVWERVEALCIKSIQSS